MSNFRGKKFIEDTNIATDEYIQWLEDQVARIPELEQKLESSTRSAANLRKRLDIILQQNNRRAKFEADYLPYDEDRFD